MGLHLSHNEHDSKGIFLRARKTNKRRREDKQTSKHTESGHFIAYYFKTQ